MNIGNLGHKGARGPSRTVHEILPRTTRSMKKNIQDIYIFLASAQETPEVWPLATLRGGKCCHTNGPRRQRVDLFWHNHRRVFLELWKRDGLMARADHSFDQMRGQFLLAVQKINKIKK